MLEVSGLKKTFTSGIISRTRIKALDGVSLYIKKEKPSEWWGKAGAESPLSDSAS